MSEDDVEGSYLKYEITNKFKDIARVVPVFQCKKCNYVDPSFENLLIHYRTHKFEIETNICGLDEEYERILVCSICFAQYTGIIPLREHMIKEHGYVSFKSNNSAICEDSIEGKTENLDQVCDLDPQNKVMTPVSFRDFKIIIKRSLIHKCPIKGCCYKFETKEKLESHQKCHISSDFDKNQEFKCLQCHKEIKIWRHCTNHMWKEHKIDIDMLSCPICSYKAHICVKIWRHMRCHSKWRSRVLKTLNINSSKNRNNGTSNRWYSQKTCQICSRKFSNSKTLSKHIKTVHNKIKPFICNVCGTKSAKKATWIIHMRQHTGEKPLQCKFCSYRASDPSVLRTHVMRHTKETRYKCRACSYTAIQANAFKLHIKVNHSEYYKQLSCDQCDYVSISTWTLEAHKKDHKKGLIPSEDSLEASNVVVMKSCLKSKPLEKPTPNMELSSDCFLPLESIDSIAPDSSIDTGGVTIPAHSEDTQFPNFINQ